MSVDIHDAQHLLRQLAIRMIKEAVEVAMHTEVDGGERSFLEDKITDLLYEYEQKGETITDARHVPKMPRSEG